VAGRNENAQRLIDELHDIPALRIPRPAANITHAYYKFYVFVVPDQLRPDWTRDRVLAAVDAEGMPGWSGSCPEIYREKAFEHRDYPVMPIAHELGRTSIMLPVHPTLRESEIDDMIQVVRKVLSVAAA
jgi:dTDP-4-amino-4,6-dideoxygalactose transaminase